MNSHQRRKARRANPVWPWRKAHVCTECGKGYGWDTQPPPDYKIHFHIWADRPKTTIHVMWVLR